MKLFFPALLLLSILLTALPLLGDDIDPNEQDPWFTGTLLAFFPRNAQPGQFAVQPTLFASRRYGIYDQNSSLTHDLNSNVYTLLLTLETGITKKIDVTLDILGIYAHNAGADSFHYGDAHIFFGFQILTDKRKTWVPDMRVVIGQGFPTGKYQHLDPAMEFADATGLGVFETSLILAVRKIFYTWPNHPYNVNINIGTFHSSRTKVKGLNVYGGDPSTNGTIGSSERFLVDLAFEFKFNKAWGCGIDFNFFYQNSASLRRRSSDIFAGSASSYLFSLAPMLEYNFSPTLGINGGFWFSVIGRNEFAFYSGVLAVFHEF